jgi:hypothetical protein
MRLLCAAEQRDTVVHFPRYVDRVEDRRSVSARVPGEAMGPFSDRPFLARAGRAAKTGARSKDRTSIALTANYFVFSPDSLVLLPDAASLSRAETPGGNRRDYQDSGILPRRINVFRIFASLDMALPKTRPPGARFWGRGASAPGKHASRELGRRKLQRLLTSTCAAVKPSKSLTALPLLLSSDEPRRGLVLLIVSYPVARTVRALASWPAHSIPAHVAAARPSAAAQGSGPHARDGERASRRPAAPIGKLSWD